MFEYRDPKREEEPMALPDVETFHVGPHDMIYDQEGCKLEPGWYWWSCFPGCLPDSEPSGPFETEQEAIEDARALNEED